MPESNAITRPKDAEVSGFDRVFSFLREQVLSGELKAGDRLAPERDLAAQLGVGRPSLREALRALAMLGVVEIRHGVGTVVQQPNLDVLRNFFSFALAHGPDVIDDVMEARIAIECQAVRLACRRATPTDLSVLDAHLARVMETLDDAEAGGQADYEFHRALVVASKSETLINIYSAISVLLMRSHVERRETTIPVDGIKNYLVDAHREIYFALLEQDPDLAESKLREHFTIGDEYRKKGLRDRATHRSREAAGRRPGY